ncbi:MAG: TolC family protein [Clostridium sp.]|nr:TolC family protein [Clostridium sp.]
MKRHISLFIAVCLACGCALAQTWTLDDCISYATAHNLTVRSRQLSAKQAEQSITDAKSAFLPRLSAGAGQSWNLGRGLTAENTYADRNTSSFNWSASFNMPVFNGLANVRQLSYAKANLQQMVEECEAAKEDITTNVISYYLQALYSREMMQVAQNQVELSEYEIRRREALLEAGKIPEIDLLEAQAQLASDKLNLTQAKNDNILARLDLILLLQLDDKTPENFDVAPLSDDDPMLIAPEEAYLRALQYSHAVEAARKGIIASDKNITLAKSGYIPTLSFNAGLGSSYYKLSGAHNDKFSDQMRHNYSTYFGFSLNIPIFDGFSTRNSVRRAKIQKLNAELNLDQTEQQLYRNIQSAYYQAVAAAEKYASSQLAEKSTAAAFEAMQEKYNLGRATSTEYEQAKTNALRATADRIQANYEMILRSRLLQFYSTPH